MTKWLNNRTEWPNDQLGLLGIVPSLMLKGHFLNIIKNMGDFDWDLIPHRFLDMLSPNLACKSLSAHSFTLCLRDSSSELSLIYLILTDNVCVQNLGNLILEVNCQLRIAVGFSITD